MRKYCDIAHELLDKSPNKELPFNRAFLQSVAKGAGNANNLPYERLLVSIDRTIRSQCERERSETRFFIDRRRGRGNVYLVLNQGGRRSTVPAKHPAGPAPQVFRLVIRGLLADVLAKAVNAGIAPEQIVRDGIAANSERIRSAINAELDSLLGGSDGKGPPNE